MTTTLILGDWLVTSASRSPRAEHGVCVIDGDVVATGTHGELRASYPDAPVVNAAGHVVMPGFVNAHTHLYGVLAHGIPAAAKPPTDFWSFLADYWWPLVEDALDSDMVVAATDWGCAEMLRSGVTSFYDILEAPNALPGALLAQKEVVERHKLRGLLSFEATERAGPDVARLGLAENLALIDACAPDPQGLVAGLMCWHTTFTCSPSFIVDAHGMAQDRGVRSHAHVNEGVHEGDWCNEHRGMRTLELYDSLGVAGPDMIASQCVQLSPRELELIRECEVNVTHMPLANCEVGGGIAPIPELINAGVTVGLGSDGYVNDFFEVMRGAFLLHKARLQDPTAMSAEQVLHAATAGGARALGLDRIGILEPGFAADLQVVNLNFPTPVTAHNLVEQVVLWRNYTHVRDVMVDGLWRVRNHEVLGVDLDQLGARCRAQATRLWQVGR